MTTIALPVLCTGELKNHCTETLHFYYVLFPFELACLIYYCVLAFLDLPAFLDFLAGTVPVVCACPYSSNIGLSAMTLYYPVQDKTATRPVNTQNYYTKIQQAENHDLSK